MKTSYNQESCIFSCRIPGIIFKQSFQNISLNPRIVEGEKTGKNLPRLPVVMSTSRDEPKSVCEGAYV